MPIDASPHLAEYNKDYGYLDEEDRKKLITPFMEQPLPKGFGDCLRPHLHQTGNGIFYGSVMNTGGMEFAATLLNYQYLFLCSFRSNPYKVVAKFFID